MVTSCFCRVGFDLFSELSRATKIRQSCILRQELLPRCLQEQSSPYRLIYKYLVLFLSIDVFCVLIGNICLPRLESSGIVMSRQNSVGPRIPRTQSTLSDS